MCFHSLHELKLNLNKIRIGRGSFYKWITYSRTRWKTSFSRLKDFFTELVFVYLLITYNSNFVNQFQMSTSTPSLGIDWADLFISLPFFVFELEFDLFVETLASLVDKKKIRLISLRNILLNETNMNMDMLGTIL